MSGKRVALLFAYAFASMILPVLIILAITSYSRAWTSTISLWALAYVAYGLIQVLLVFPIMGSWAAAVTPQTTMKASSEELKAKLLSLNDDKIPFIVKYGPKLPDRLLASWKITDEKWIELFAKRGLRIQYELKMKIDDEKGRVLAQDNFRKFEYSGGLGSNGVRFARKLSFFKGIQLFQYERGAQYGIIYKDGQIKTDYAYNYKFDINEVKNPIIRIVTSAGYEYRPVIFIN